MVECRAGGYEGKSLITISVFRISPLVYIKMCIYLLCVLLCMRGHNVLCALSAFTEMSKTN